MKYIYLFLVFVVPAGLIGQAQNQNPEIQNKYIIGGSFNFQSQNNTYPSSFIGITSGIGGIYSNSTNDSENTVFSFTPYIGKLMNEHWTMGLQLDFRIGNYTSKDEFDFINQSYYDFERKSNQLGFGLFGRYTMNPDNKFNAFLEPYARYSILNEDQFRDDIPGQIETANYIDLGIGLGFIYNISDQWRAIGRLGGVNYISGSWEIKEADIKQEFSTISTNLRLSSMSLGVEYQF